jgi:hypothetical protein
MLHIGAAILGAIGGFFIGIAVYQFLFFFTESQILLTSLSVIGSIGMAVMSFRNYDNIVIFGTAFIGSYAFTRGISLFLLNFPNEIQLFNKIVDGKAKEFTWHVYFYMACFVTLFIIGVF